MLFGPLLGQQPLAARVAGGALVVETRAVEAPGEQRSAADASKLNSLLQTSQEPDDDLGAPAAAVYESHSQNIIETLNGLLDKAETQLSEARKAETDALYNPSA